MSANDFVPDLAAEIYVLHRPPIYLKHWRSERAFASCSHAFG
jgi:hypothetical protein